MQASRQTGWHCRSLRPDLVGSDGEQELDVPPSRSWHPSSRQRSTLWRLGRGRQRDVIAVRGNEGDIPVDAVDSEAP